MRRTYALLGALFVVVACGALAVMRLNARAPTTYTWPASSASMRPDPLPVLTAGGDTVGTAPESVTLLTLAPSPSASPDAGARAGADAAAPAPPRPGTKDGLVTTLTITTEPFEIRKRYRSMEGPHADYDLRADGTLRASAPSRPRELWWWKGASIELVDDAGRPLGQEFMCHMNIDVDARARDTAFPGTRVHTRRLLTLTQGEPRFELPAGWGVPVASDEMWSLVFQVLNHNREGTFRVRQRLTLYFVRDADLFAPIDALTWHAAYVWVSLSKSDADAVAWDEKQCGCCAPLARALEATNNVPAGRAHDPAGRTLVGHWTVPPGKNTWTFPVARAAPEFAPKGQKLFAAWTHVHPFASEVRLVAHAPGCAPQVVAKSTIDSLQGGLVGLSQIRSPVFPEGAPLPDGAAFELAVDYDNTSGRAQDSMTSFGMFVDDPAWKRPAWAERGQNPIDMDGSCGVGP